MEKSLAAAQLGQPAVRCMARGTRKVEARVRAHAESREARCLTPLAGILEGQSLGREKGRELGHELGFYAGCAECWYSVHARDAP